MGDSLFRSIKQGKKLAISCIPCIFQISYASTCSGYQVPQLSFHPESSINCLTKCSSSAECRGVLPGTCLSPANAGWHTKKKAGMLVVGQPCGCVDGWEGGQADGQVGEREDGWAGRQTDIKTDHRKLILMCQSA